MVVVGVVVIVVVVVVGVYLVVSTVGTRMEKKDSFASYLNEGMRLLQGSMAFKDSEGSNEGQKEKQAMRVKCETMRVHRRA